MDLYVDHAEWGRLHYIGAPRQNCIDLITSKVSATAIKFYLFLELHKAKYTPKTISLSFAAEVMGVNKRTLVKARKELEKLGIIDTARTTADRNGTQYVIANTAEMEATVEAAKDRKATEKKKRNVYRKLRNYEQKLSHPLSLPQINKVLYAAEVPEEASLESYSETQIKLAGKGKYKPKPRPKPLPPVEEAPPPPPKETQAPTPEPDTPCTPPPVRQRKTPTHKQQRGKKRGWLDAGPVMDAAYWERRAEAAIAKGRALQQERMQAP